jgi:hypothetical protein
MAPLLFISLTGLLDMNARRSNTGLVFSVAALAGALGWYGIGLYATYYTLCGDLLYSAQDCAQPVYKNLDKAGAPEITLDGQKVLRQEITNTCDHLTGVNVLVKSLPTAQAGSLTLTLFDPQGTQSAVATYPLADLIPGSYVYLPAEIGAEGKNRRFVLQLSADNLTGSTGPGAALTIGNYYTGGNLSAAGDEIPADLIFHYFCARP